MAGSDNTAIQVRNAFEKNFAAGESIFEEADEGGVLYVIQSGEVTLTRGGILGRHEIANLGPGEFFGEMSVVLGERRTARATALCETRLLELDGETLEAMCIERPEIAIRIISRLTKRLIESERRLAALGIDDLLRSVVRTLVKRAEPQTGEGVRIPGTLREIAEETGLTLPETHCALHKLFDQKILRLIDDTLSARDLDSLAASLDAAA